jgi:hypothetical protein
MGGEEVKLTALERWEQKIIPEPNTGCYLWISCHNPYGYGWTMMGREDNALMGRGRRTTAVLAHRKAWMLFRGPIPGGMDVLHHCDNPPCVNPDHLYLGTQQENARDMVRRKRWSPPSQKLTHDDVLKIREDRRPYRIIAAEYSVGIGAISSVKRRVSFKQV